MLYLYYKNSEDAYVEVSNSDDLTSPLSTLHDGNKSTKKVVQLFLRNDESTKWYSNIKLLPYDLVDANPYGDVAYDETGWGVKLSSEITEPTTGEWEDINWGEEISMSNVGSDSLGDITTYSPFYYLITSPPNLDAQNKIDIVIDLYYTENAVS